jgi:hypothetical protein
MSAGRFPIRSLRTRHAVVTGTCLPRNIRLLKVYKILSDYLFRPIRKIAKSDYPYVRIEQLGSPLDGF